MVVISWRHLVLQVLIDQAVSCSWPPGYSICPTVPTSTNQHNSPYLILIRWFTFQLKIMHTCPHISNYIIWLGIQTFTMVMRLFSIIWSWKFIHKFTFCRGNGYPKLWPSPNCTEPLDVSSNFTFEVISGILSG